MPDHTKAVAYKTVATFAKICKKRLFLQNAKKACTDGQGIWAPFDDPWFLRLVDHELAHILFRSDADARDTFVATYATLIVNAAFKAGKQRLDVNSIREVVSGILQVLEDVRVDSLWGLLYPGSYVRSRQMKLENVHAAIVEGMDVTSKILPAFLAFTAGHEDTAGAMGRFRPYFAEACWRVERRSFPATLLATKWLVAQLVNEILRELDGQPPLPLPEHADAVDSMLDELASNTTATGSSGTGGTADGATSEQTSPSRGAASEETWEPPPLQTDPTRRAEALERLVRQWGEVPEERFSQDVNPPEHKGLSRTDSKNSQHVGATLAKIDLRDARKIAELLCLAQQEVNTLLDTVRKALVATQTRDTWLKGDVHATVRFQDKIAAPSEVLPEDQQAIQRLRATFIRQLGRRAWELVEAGNTINVSAYLERRLSGVSQPCFEQTALGRGFHALVLVDLSGSMASGTKIPQIDRASRVLTSALRFPFCALDIWGFRSNNDGEVNLIRFSRKRSPQFESYVGGNTPLHGAIAVAVRHLSESSAVKHLFVLTDGAPFFVSRDGCVVSSDALQQQVRAGVRKGNKQGVTTHALQIGKRIGEGYAYDIPASAMTRMFGSGCWAAVTEENLLSELVKVVTKQFSRYVRS